MPTARRARGWASTFLPLLGLALLVGCGWAPLYADPEAGPADADLAAIGVSPIAERIGQRLALALRESLNPSGAAVPQRYSLGVFLTTARTNLGVQTQGLGTRGRLDAYATSTLSDIKTGGVLLQTTSHVAESFDILANEYSDLVAEEDARNRATEDLRRDIVNRLTVFLQRRAAAPPAKP